MTYDRTAAATLSFADLADRQVSAWRVASDLAPSTDAATRVVSFPRSASATTALPVATAARVVDAQRVAGVDLAGTDLTTRIVSYARSLAEAVSVPVASAVRQATYPRTAGDALPSIPDTASRNVGASRTASEMAPLTALAERIASYFRQADQSAATPVAVGSFTREKIYFREASESVVQVAQTARQISYVRAASELASETSQTTTRVLTYWRSVDVAVSDLVEVASRAAGYSRIVSSQIVFTLEALYERLTGRRPVRMTVMAGQGAALSLGTVEHLG